MALQSFNLVALPHAGALVASNDNAAPRPAQRHQTPTLLFGLVIQHPGRAEPVRLYSPSQMDLLRTARQLRAADDAPSLTLLDPHGQVMASMTGETPHWAEPEAQA